MSEAPEMMLVAVGEKVRARRIALGYELQQIAECIAVTPALLGTIEAGSTRLSAQALALLSAALGVSPAWFFEGLSPEAQRAARRACEIPVSQVPAPQSLRLIRAFTRVRGPAARTAILDLVSCLAE